MVGDSTAFSVATAVAEQVERTGGPRAGLTVWRALAARATSAEVRGTALLAALRCALECSELGALDELIGRWEAVGSGAWDRAVVRRCKAMMRAGERSRAAALAGAEARRHPTALSLYCHARCLDIVGDADAARVFGACAERAQKEGAREIECAARVRRITLLARSWETASAAFEEASQIDTATLPVEALVALGRVLLRAPSRFMRAAGLGHLDQVVETADEVLARRALAIVARWVDDLSEALTPLEEDRLLSLLGRERARALAPRLRDVVRVIVDMAKAADDRVIDAAMAEAVRFEPTLAPLHARARAVVAGGRAGGEGDSPQGAVLDLAVALRDGASLRVAYVLRGLAEADARGEPVPPAVLAFARRALASADAEVRAAAIQVVESGLRRLRRGPANGGYVAIARALAAADERELAKRAYRAAVVGKEEGAKAALGLLDLREAWAAAGAGKRSEAIEKLRAAKALLA